MTRILEDENGKRGSYFAFLTCSAVAVDLRITSRILVRSIQRSLLKMAVI